MLRIVLKDGRELPNDPQYGWNLTDREDIIDCLRVTGRYWLSLAGGRDETLYADDVASVEDSSA